MSIALVGQDLACRFSEDRLKSVLQETLVDRLKSVLQETLVYRLKSVLQKHTDRQTKVCPTGTLFDRLKSVLQKDGESCGNR